jgi:hypothetical protein
MKRFLLLSSLFLAIASFGQSVPDISFTTATHNFGKIKQNVPVTFLFTFTNNASKPAVIEFANAECGCTTPEYSKDPILKGKTSNIKVTYNAATAGSFKKNVNIKFASATLPITLTIEGEVIPAKAKSK